MAHAHELRNGGHRESRAVGRPNGRISLIPQGFGSLLQCRFALGMFLGEGCQPSLGLWGLAFGSGDLKIV
jgi:hypothetical protein